MKSQAAWTGIIALEWAGITAALLCDCAGLMVLRIHEFALSGSAY